MFCQLTCNLGPFAGLPRFHCRCESNLNTKYRSHAKRKFYPLVKSTTIRVYIDCSSEISNQRSSRKGFIDFRSIQMAGSSATELGNKLLSLGTKIVAVGRNYAAHAKELGNAVPKEPVLFLKPTSSYLQSGGTIEIPHPLESLHYELELAVVIGKKARDVRQVHAMDFVEGYALALDMTARDIQSTAKAAGLPWTVAKGYDTFTPISSYIPKSMIPDQDSLELWLKVDGEIKQKGSTKDMIFKIPYLISHISSIMTLFEGDVILTGTPPGVGPVKAGQKITAGITDLIEMSFDVQHRQKVVD